MEKYFPLQTDSFDDFVTLSIPHTIDKEKLIEISTLLPIIAQWCAVLELNDSYLLVGNITKNIFPNTTLQIWYPDQDTEKFIYIGNAGFESGVVDAPIIIPETMEEMKTMIKNVQENIIKFEDLSSIKRTPFLPFYWQQLYNNKLLGLNI